MKTYSKEIVACSMSEKYDGVQGIWNGKELVTRTGGRIDAPGWWTAGLPDKELVGELWIGHGQFEVVKAIVQSNGSPAWKSVRFMVFAGAGPYEWLGGYALPIYKIRGTHQVYVDAFYKAVIANGGEGIVVKDAAGEEYKRTPVQDDDGEVAGYSRGMGKYRGLVGSLILKLRSGRQLKVGNGLNDDLRKNPPAVGTIVKFAYSGKTVTGLPRFPRFLGVRLETSLVF